MHFSRINIVVATLAAASLWPGMTLSQATLPVVDTLIPSLQSPSSETGRLNEVPANGALISSFLKEDSFSESDLTNGVPGIDGINVSPAALASALRGLNPAELEGLLRGASPELVRQITENLTGELKGLDNQTLESLGALPGVDGLPIDSSSR